MCNLKLRQLPARPVPEFIDPVFAKTSQNARFLLSENERFGLVFVKTGSINSVTDLVQNKPRPASMGTDWIENERFGLIFSKTIIFTPKTGSINSGTDHDQLLDVYCVHQSREAKPVLIRSVPIEYKSR